MRPEMNTYYMVTDLHRHYQFQHQHCPTHQQNHNHIQQRVHGSQNNSQHQQHHYPNGSQTTKESIRLCNPFEESLITSPTSSSNSNMMATYLERHSSTG